MGGPPDPAGEERLGRPGVDVLPELPEALLQSPGSRHLEVRVLQRAERGPRFRGHVRESGGPQIRTVW